MLKTTLAIAALTGLPAFCAIGDSEVVCEQLEAPVQALSDALVANPNTPRAVGIAGAEVVIITQGGCG